MNRVLALAMALWLIMAIAAAQETPVSPYQPITLNNLDQLEVVYSAECKGESSGGDDRGSSSFLGLTFVYRCSTKTSPKNRTELIAYSFAEERELWRFVSLGGSYRFDLIADNLVLMDGQSSLVLRTETGDWLHEEEFIVHGATATSPDYQTVAVVKGDFDVANVTLFTLPDFAPVERTFPTTGHTSPIALSSSEQGLIAIAENNRMIRVYDIVSGEVVMAVEDVPFPTSWSPDYKQPYEQLLFSPDASQLLVSQCTSIEMGCYQMGIALLDIASGEVLNMVYLEEAFLDFMNFLPQTSVLVASTRCYQVHFIELPALEITSLLNDPNQYCRFSDAELGASMNQEGTLIAVQEYREEGLTYRVYGIPAGS